MAKFSKILFPTDFSPASHNALQHALLLAGAGAAEVVVQHVVGTYFEKHSHFATLFDIHELQKYMDMYTETEMEKIVPKDTEGTVSFRSVISEGRPAQQITELADKEKVDLIVMGPAKGAVTGSVIRGSSHPVLSVPSTNGSAAPEKLSRMLVTTDFSDNSKKVIRFAMELKELLDCNVDVLYAIELSNAIRFGIRQGHFRDAPQKMRTWADNQLKSLIPHQYLTDSSVRRVVEEGPAPDTIAKVSEENDADLIVMGARSHSAAEKFIVGTTTEKVLSRAQRPVLTLRI
jgi:nucleotide-binding universal stress UspA family protein